MPINYSKWDKLELSDDEDNFHPNIDNNLMIRLQREKRQQREKEEAEKKKKLLEEGTPEALAEVEKIERMAKLHVGNICTDKFSSKHEKTKASASADEPKPQADTKLKVAASEPETFTEGYEEFLAANQAILTEYSEIDHEDDRSEQYILEHTQLLSEHATGYYLLHCINLQAAGKTRSMRKVARQYLLLTYVCDLAKSMPGRDARDAIKPLFKKMNTSAESREAFDEHLEKYVAHVKTRAEVKKEEDEKKKGEDAEYEYVPLEKGEQLGPGGLDPAEVFESLPREMQDAFGERSVEALKAVIARMPEAEAAMHMKRCIDSGLWDPAGGTRSADDEAEERVAPAEVDTSPSAEVDD
mmetsp:Transcript_27550/g.87637  ORF Transcript_27550/g.87637 Transcript_27550/m.87637 type:complete len:356 (+) Transcript_27550:74-1141(+)